MLHISKPVFLPLSFISDIPLPNNNTSHCLMQPLTRRQLKETLLSMFEQGDADSLCCFQCHGAFTIRWQVNVHAQAYRGVSAGRIAGIYSCFPHRYTQGTKSTRAQCPVTPWRCAEALRLPSSCSATISMYSAPMVSV